jgi:hypothetical protein
VAEVVVAADVPQPVHDLGPHPGRTEVVGGAFRAAGCHLCRDRRSAGRARLELVRLGGEHGADGSGRAGSGVPSAAGPGSDGGCDLAGALPDRQDQPGRAEVAERVDQDRHRSRQDRDDPAAERLAEDLRRRLADLELRVPLDELVALEDRRKVRLVRDVEEDGHQTIHEADDVELPDRQRPQGKGDRDRGEHHRPAQVAEDQDPALREAVDPDTGREREEEEGQEFDRRQQADLARRALQEDGGDERDGDLADLRAEQRHGRGGPQPGEVGMVAEEAKAGCGRHRR